MKYKECPDCDGKLSTVLAENRLNQQLCENCWWEGEPFVPETKEITGKRKISDHLSGCYQIFDRYGQGMVTSRRYGSDAECRDELASKLKYYNKKYTAEQGGPFTGIAWPMITEIQGEIFK